jgi:hypothetical protein
VAIWQLPTEGAALSVRLRMERVAPEGVTLYCLHGVRPGAVVALMCRPVWTQVVDSLRC